MSRCYTKKGDGWMRKLQPKPFTLAWAKARSARHKRRLNIEQQSRDKLGFILKVRPEDGTTVTYDPGQIDRWLWVQANPDDSDS